MVQVQVNVGGELGDQEHPQGEEGSEDDAYGRVLFHPSRIAEGLYQHRGHEAEDPRTDERGKRAKTLRDEEGHDYARQDRMGAQHRLL
jgi:hypothetical protein